MIADYCVPVLTDYCVVLFTDNRGTDFPNIPLYNLVKIPTRFIKSDKIATKELKEFDLVVEMSGGSKNQATGRSVFITKEFLSRYNLPILYSNFCKRIRVNKEIIDPRFFNLYWNLIYREGLTARYENQPSGIKNFQLEELISNEVIHLPPLEVQNFLIETILPFSELTDLLSSTSNLINEAEEEMFNKIYNNYEE